MRVIADCGAYPNLYFMIDNKWIQVEAKDYVIRENWFECSFLI